MGELKGEAELRIEPSPGLLTRRRRGTIAFCRAANANRNLERAKGFEPSTPTLASGRLRRPTGSTHFSGVPFASTLFESEPKGQN